MIKNKKEKIIIGVLIVAFVIVCYLITEHKKASQYEYRVTRENTIILEKYLGDDEVVKIPSKLYGKKVVKLEQCFEGNSIIQEVDIPATVTTMTETFRNASNLRRVTGGEGVETMLSAFANCVSLERFPDFSNIKYIFIDSFWGCTALESINLPEGLESIGGYAFAGAENLKEVVIPKTVVDIGANAFIGTSWYDSLPAKAIVGDGVLVKLEDNREEMWIDEGVKCIGNSVIYDKEMLKKLYIPSTVKSARGMRFDLSKKVEVYMPSSVESILIYNEEGEGLENLTLIVEEGSFAQTYAIENGFNYEIVDDVQAIYESTLAESQSE